MRLAALLLLALCTVSAAEQGHLAEVRQFPLGTRALRVTWTVPAAEHRLISIQVVDTVERFLEERNGSGSRNGVPFLAVNDREVPKGTATVFYGTVVKGLTEAESETLFKLVDGRDFRRRKDLPAEVAAMVEQALATAGR